MGKILIADDSSFQRKILGDMMASLGYEITEASSGREVLEALNNDSFDCLCLDLLMPEMTGMEVLETLQHQTDVPPIIVISADIQEKKKEQCMALGARAFINKSIKRAELEEHLNKVIDSE